ncbi:MAG TPA: hypothetical protein VKK61_04260 [Tepidisphaeraceae bacterium]|nr:hypothetical protein [Tepidisphaeraceae bacterium]
MTQPNIETEIPVDRSRLGAAAMRLSAALLIFAALAVVYARALNVPFVFDDTVSIVKNPSIVRLWPLFGVGGNPGPLNPTSGIPTAGRPLVNLSFAINYHFGGLNTFGYRLFNLILHAMSALLIWRILARALRLDYFAGRFDRAAEPLALAVALLWAVHPLNTETIIYTTQRTELMVGLFYLATFYGCLRYWGAQSPAARTGWLIVTTVACLVGAGCKEVIATAPLIMLIFERTFISGTFERALRRSWPLYVGMILSWLVLIGLNLSSPRSGTAGFNVQGLPVLAWWFTQAKVFLIYLKLVVWPWPLAIHY